MPFHTFFTCQIHTVYRYRRFLVARINIEKDFHATTNPPFRIHVMFSIDSDCSNVTKKWITRCQQAARGINWHLYCTLGKSSHHSFPHQRNNQPKPLIFPALSSFCRIISKSENDYADASGARRSFKSDQAAAQ